MASAVHCARHHGQGVEVLYPPGALGPPEPGEGDQLRRLGPVPEQPVEEDAEEAVQERLGQRAEDQQPAPPPRAAQPSPAWRLGAPDNKRGVRRSTAVRSKPIFCPNILIVGFKPSLIGFKLKRSYIIFGV